LQDSRFILADNVGVATAVAWSLKRSDILMFDEKGELQYGLSYPDAKDNFIDAAGFPAWLQKARQEGNVSVILRLDRNAHVKSTMPAADQTVKFDRQAILFYKKLP
jgi:4-amino-4-deoxy-L-arabinose transferase